MEYPFDKYRTTEIPNSDEIKQKRKGKKTVAMVGMANTSRHLAPYDDLSIPIWALNESATPRFDYLKRCDRIYQLHPEWDWSRPYNHNYEKYPEWLKEKHGNMEIVMQEKYEQVPNAVKYPFDEIVAKFGGEAMYFTSSMPYLVAHALYENYTRIELYGFEMAANEEYANQKPCAEFWLGVAIGRGCEVYVPPGNPLLGKTMQLYGYEMAPGILPMHIEIRKRAYITDQQRASKEMAEHEGQKKQILEKIKTITDDAAKRVEWKKVTELDNKLSWDVARLNVVNGLLYETTIEENSLSGHLQQWHSVYDKNMPMIVGVRTTPALTSPVILPQEMLRLRVDGKEEKPKQDPRAALARVQGRHRHKKRK